MLLSIILPAHKEPSAEFLMTLSYELPHAEIIVSRDRDRKGKGWAIREALKHCKGQYIAFLDSDGDIEPRMLQRLIPFIDDFDAVVGSKRINHKHLKRRIVTLLSRIYIRFTFGIFVDTQTGIKIFRRSVLKDWITDGFFFDVEILESIKRSGASIVEVPIEAVISENIQKGAIWRTLKESLILKLRLLFHAKK